MLTLPLNKDLRNSHCLWASSDYSSCSSNRQFALKVTHAIAQSRFKNVIFRHHYVMQKIAVLLTLSNVAFAEFFTSTAKMQC